MRQVFFFHFPLLFESQPDIPGTSQNWVSRKKCSTRLLTEVKSMMSIATSSNHSSPGLLLPSALCLGTQLGGAAAAFPFAGSTGKSEHIS